MLSLAQTLENTLAAAADLIPSEDLKETRQELGAWLREAKIKVLVFGCYDAGKTTLINAMTGADLDRGPVPTTQVLEDVIWPSGEFLLLDSPGLFAPGGAKDAMVREAAAWQADLVLIVLGAESQLEHHELWEQIRIFLGRKMSLFIVFNERDAGLFQSDSSLRDRITAMVRGRLGSVCQDAPTFIGPLFVNALSALTSRRAKPCKRQLEAYSRVPQLEAEIQAWVAASGRQAGLQRLAGKVGDQLAAAQERLEKELGRLEPARHEALEAIQRVRTEFGNAFKLRVQGEIESRCSQAVGLLGHRREATAGSCQKLLADGLGVLTETAEDLLRTRLLELCGEDLPGEVAFNAAPRSQVILDPVLPTIPGPRSQGGNPGGEAGSSAPPTLVSPSIAMASKVMRDTGTLRSLAQKGIIGKAAGNWTKPLRGRGDQRPSSPVAR